ncbi:MAG: CTP synthetase, partial [Planctomycetes bacterium]|nr:CTP synthetase [Planctomycetota bacterium]
LATANSTEFDAQTDHPVICLLEDQHAVTEKGATMRLGAQPCVLGDNTAIAKCYGTKQVSERHRHRYEFNPDYRGRFREAGLGLCGVSPDGKLVEAIEISSHRWFVAVQFHPEFKSKPSKAHPLFHGFIAAALARRQKRV